jgi:hypothetical protein
LPLPAALPPDSIISTALVKLNSYALKGPFLPELEKQLGDLIAWMGNPIQLDRQGALARGVGSETLKRHKDLTLGYLGFCHHFLNQPLSTVDLSLFEDPSLILSFCLFLKVR